MKNFNIGHRANFSVKLIINLYLLFPVRAISRGFVTSGDASDVTADRTRASCEILANSDFIYLFYGFVPRFMSSRFVFLSIPTLTHASTLMALQLLNPRGWFGVVN